MRLTEYAHGGGCACKIPPGELEEMVASLVGVPSATSSSVSTTATTQQLSCESTAMALLS